MFERDSLSGSEVAAPIKPIDVCDVREFSILAFLVESDVMTYSHLRILSASKL